MPKEIPDYTTPDLLEHCVGLRAAMNTRGTYLPGFVRMLFWEHLRASQHELNQRRADRSVSRTETRLSGAH